MRLKGVFCAFCFLVVEVVVAVVGVPFVGMGEGERLRLVGLVGLAGSFLVSGNELLEISDEELMLDDEACLLCGASRVALESEEPLRVSLPGGVAFVALLAVVRVFSREPSLELEDDSLSEDEDPDDEAGGLGLAFFDLTDGSSSLESLEVSDEDEDSGVGDLRFSLFDLGFGEGAFAGFGSSSSSASLSELDADDEEEEGAFGAGSLFFGAALVGSGLTDPTLANFTPLPPLALSSPSSLLLSSLLLSSLPLLLVTSAFLEALAPSNFAFFFAILSRLVVASSPSSLLVMSNSLLSCHSLYHSL